MKRIFFIALIILLFNPAKVKANEIVNCIATAYSPTGNLTYTETVPRLGVAAGKKEWLGKTAIVFWDDGDGLIKPQNYYTIISFEDLGGTKAINAGRVIDIFLNTKEEAIQFGSKKVIIQIIDSEG